MIENVLVDQPTDDERNHSEDRIATDCRIVCVSTRSCLGGLTGMIQRKMNKAQTGI